MSKVSRTSFQLPELPLNTRFRARKIKSRRRTHVWAVWETYVTEDCRPVHAATTGATVKIDMRAIFSDLFGFTSFALPLDLLKELANIPANISCEKSAAALLFCSRSGIMHEGSFCTLRCMEVHASETAEVL